MGFSADTERVIAVLAQVAAIWQERLDGNWAPPAESAFPWAQVRLSLGALLPGMRDARTWVERKWGSPPVLGAGGAPHSFTATIVLAGNTPLLAWSPLCACLLAGVRTVRVKLSRDETAWTRLFVESLRDAEPELAGRIELYDFPGEDERTYALLQDTDAVIAYGSDAAINALQARTPPGVPFFGFGHAVSVGFYPRTVGGYPRAELAARLFARDVLMYGQQGCLSPHVIYARRRVRRRMSDLDAMSSLALYLASALPVVADVLCVFPVTDPATARRVRTARELALFGGMTVLGDDDLRWTVIASADPLPHPEPVGHGVVYVSPAESPEQLRELLQPIRGIVSCAGVMGKEGASWEAVLREAGVSRSCEPGEMQTPPLDWQNGNRDLLAELRKITGD